MTALMGASGAGKSTLMDVICGRKTGGKLTGDILVNGHPKHQQAFARVMGCVRVAIVSVVFRQCVHHGVHVCVCVCVCVWRVTVLVQVR